jgi:hypothetical protein
MEEKQLQIRMHLMAFWIKKKTDETEGNEISNSNNSKLLRKKDEKKDNKPRRIDNLRIPQQLNIVLKSIGSPVEIPFVTKDLSATGAFVLCPQFRKTPFQQQNTLLDCTVELRNPESHELQTLKFLAKIARVVAATGTGAMSISGFGIRICQISMDQRLVLEQFIQKHGAPEGNPGAETENESAEMEAAPSAFETDEETIASEPKNMPLVG